MPAENRWGPYANWVCCRDCGTWLARDWFYDNKDGRFLCRHCAEKAGRPTRF